MKLKKLSNAEKTLKLIYAKHSSAAITCAITNWFQGVSTKKGQIQIQDVEWCRRGEGILVSCIYWVFKNVNALNKLDFCYILHYFGLEPWLPRNIVKKNLAKWWE